jgi:hypothetical protein
VRFAIAVVASGLVQLVPYLRTETPAVLAVAYVVFAALGAGFFAGHRGWLAGALSVLLGAALYGVLSRWGPGAEGGGTLEDIVRVAGFVLGIAPYALVGALAGAGGEALRSRIMAPAR